MYFHCPDKALGLKFSELNDIATSSSSKKRRMKMIRKMAYYHP